MNICRKRKPADELWNLKWPRNAETQRMFSTNATQQLEFHNLATSLLSHHKKQGDFSDLAE